MVMRAKGGADLETRLMLLIRSASRFCEWFVEPTEHTVTRADEQRVTRDRGCVGESASGCFPDGLFMMRRAFEFRAQINLALAGVVGVVGLHRVSVSVRRHVSLGARRAEAMAL